MSNFYISITLYTLYISIASLIFFINSMVEVKLIYDVWILSNPDLINNHRELKRRLILFYFVYYLILFVLINNVVVLYTNDILSLLLTATIWLPSIISNLNKKNFKHPPLIICLLVSINRVYMHMYLNMNKKENNILHSHCNNSMVYFDLLLLAVQHIFLYVLPLIFKGKCARRVGNEETSMNVVYMDFRMYIQKFPEDYQSLECSICMTLLYDQERKVEANEDNIRTENEMKIIQCKDNNINRLPLIDSQSKSVDFNLEDSTGKSIIESKSTSMSSNNSMLDVNYSYDKISINTNNSNSTDFMINQNEKSYKLINEVINTGFSKIKSQVFILIDVLFLFHNLKKQKKTELIQTECNHIFHSQCLRDWIKIKYTCPIDRREIIIEE